ncbi:MAG: hypothetical protein BV457_00080 [Thermoplasmata archaeon M9B1D]|nr:MAG: hypothetical protein BV457_00080 [Thermoplasmata archaeon M9B1D]PNX52238.1 MAG: hypothetical protein BV456_00215 [Thermoplasmata archaeon M8B2D]
MYTSLEFSKKLKENGCELESERYYYKGNISIADYHDEVLGALSNFYKAYDILNEICVEYATQFFGDKEISKNYGNENIGDIFVCFKAYEYHTQNILEMLQKDKPQEEIEKYIEDNCVFFNKDKEER